MKSGAVAGIPPPTPAAGGLPAQVMLLSLWSAPGRPWHVRLVAADDCVFEFDSPFELARFLAQASARPPIGGDAGLR